MVSEPLAALRSRLAWARRSAPTLHPSVVVSELEQVAAEAIRTASHPTTPGFTGLIDRFLADRERLLRDP